MPPCTGRNKPCPLSDSRGSASLDCRASESKADHQTPPTGNSDSTRSSSLPKEALQHIFNTSQLHQCRELWHHFHFAHGGRMRSASKTTSVFPLGIGKEPVVFQMEDKGKSRLRPLLVPKAFSAALSSCSQLVSPTSPQPAQGRHPLYFSTGVSGNQHRQPRLEANIKFPIKIQYCNCLQIKEK